MTKSNLFKNLSEKDGDLILDLCNRFPYDEVVRRLLQPRQHGGLNLKTSTSALCRFYTRYQPEIAGHVMMTQYGKTLLTRREQNPGATLGGILALVESGLLYALKIGRPIADLTPEFRNLARVHKAFVADEKLRAAQGPVESKKVYQEYIAEQAAHPSVDFIRHTIPHDPRADGCVAEQFNDQDQDTLDIQHQRELLATTAQEKSIAIRTLEIEASPEPVLDHDNGSSATLPLPPASPAKSEILQTHSTAEASQTPVIPQIPLFSDAVLQAQDGQFLIPYPSLPVAPIQDWPGRKIDFSQNLFTIAA